LRFNGNNIIVRNVLCKEKMENLIKQLEEIEKEHSLFFAYSDKDITDYITQGIFGASAFTNTELA
jgi:hypothetical protein